MYSILKPIMFMLDAELAHGLTLRLLNLSRSIGLLDLIIEQPTGRPFDVMGLQFSSRIGLAAGMDKNGDHIDALADCGFAFIEIGTVTPKPQPGNDKPRLFRLKQHKAIINRMGFNNKGVDYLVQQVRKRSSDCVLGINIGKNKLTPNEQALDDYLIGLRTAYEVADYIAINISSPNTPGLRELQNKDELLKLLEGLMQERNLLAGQHGKKVPLAVKIAPDLSDEELAGMVEVFKQCGIDAVIATNTTNDREAVAGDPLAAEQGGLSGLPLRERSNQVLAKLVELLDGAMPVIAVGGVMTAGDAAEKVRLGASLVQIYSGFVYAGPALVTAAVSATNYLEAVSNS